MGNPRGVLKPIKVTSAATTAQHAQDPGQELVIGVVRPTRAGLRRFREALGDEGELAWGEDVG